METLTLKPGTAKDWYRKLEPRREPFLKRARECAKYTIPSLLPEKGHNYTQALRATWQSIGARGVRNLSAKMVLGTMPPNEPAFRVLPNFLDLEELKKSEGGAEIASDFMLGLSKYERAVQDEIEQSGDRPVVFEIFDHLIVTGNALMADLNDGLKMYPISNYVCRRDPQGNTLEIISVETVDPSVLPETVQNVARDSQDPNKAVELYTVQKRDGKRWQVWQEVSGIVVPGSEGSYPLDAPAFNALRFTVVSSEDYGRSYVEEYIGDLKSLEGLRKATVEGNAAAARLLILVDPNGTTKMETIAQAPNGAIRQGRADDVTTVQMNKFNDFATAREMAMEIKRDLEMAFLMFTTVQRDAERVTAEEIRYIVQELQNALGATFSTVNKEFQLPYTKRKINKMERAGKLPILPKKDVKIVIVAGFDALGRGQDLNKLEMFLRGAAQDLGPQAIAQYVKPGELLKRRAMAVGIDTEGLIKTEEEIAQEQQQAQQMAMLQQVGPEVLKQMGSMATANQQEQPAQPQQ